MTTMTITAAAAKSEVIIDHLVMIINVTTALCRVGRILQTISIVFVIVLRNPRSIAVQIPVPSIVV